MMTHWWAFNKTLFQLKWGVLGYQTSANIEKIQSINTNYFQQFKIITNLGSSARDEKRQTMHSDDVEAEVYHCNSHTWSPLDILSSALQSDGIHIRMRALSICEVWISFHWRQSHKIFNGERKIMKIHWIAARYLYNFDRCATTHNRCATIKQIFQKISTKAANYTFQNIYSNVGRRSDEITRQFSMVVETWNKRLKKGDTHISNNYTDKFSK